MFFFSRLLLYIKFDNQPGYPLCTNINTTDISPQVLSILKTNIFERQRWIKIGKIVRYFFRFSMVYLFLHTIYYSLILTSNSIVISNNQVTSQYEMSMFAFLGYALYFNQTGMFFYVSFFLIKFESRLKYLMNQIINPASVTNTVKTQIKPKPNLTKKNSNITINSNMSVNNAGGVSTSMHIRNRNNEKDITTIE